MMAILFDAPRRASSEWFLAMCQRIDEPITDRLMHGASAFEESEFSEIELGRYFMPQQKYRDGRHNQRFKVRQSGLERVLEAIAGGCLK